MADLEALEAAVDAESEGETTHDTGGASSEVIRRMGVLKKAFLARKLADATPTDFDLYVSGAKRETTVLLNRGLRLKKKSDGAMYFHCCLAGCWVGTRDESGELTGSRHVIRCPKQATSNATTHLRLLHGVESSKVKACKTRVKASTDGVEQYEAVHARDPVAFTENTLVLWATEHSIPISAFQSNYFLQILHRIPGCGRNLMERQRCRKLLLQQYLTVKERIRNEIASAKTYFGSMPFVSVNLDLYQDPRQNKKYMAIRISWVDVTNIRLKSRLIAARHYNPTYHEKQSMKASSLLAKWYKAVVETEYRISSEMVLGGTGDGGPDVKKVMREHVGNHGFQEWCISHMLNCAFVEAFGVSVDKVRTTDWLLLTLYRIVSHSPCNLSRRRARTRKHARSLQRCERRSSRSVSRPTCDLSLKRSRNSRDQIGKLSRLAIHPCIVGDQRRLRS
jgi:hypothetical protein